MRRLRAARVWSFRSSHLAGEHLYEDKTSLKVEEVTADEAILRVRAKESFAEQYAKLEAERGEHFWVLSHAADDDASADLHRPSPGRDHRPRP
jgi:hypothetical protein